MSGPERVAVIGAGGWGTALAAHLAAGGAHALLWARRPEAAAEIAAGRENARLLPGVVLPPALEITASPKRLAEFAPALCVLAVPTHGVRAVAAALSDAIPREALLVSVVKGFEMGTRMRPSEVLRAALGGRDRPVTILSGPSHAEEVGRGVPTAVVAASTRAEDASRVQRAFHGGRFRVYTHGDALGVELAGALKNIIAIACGVSDGLGFGDNARAALITRGLAEMTRLGAALGGRRETFAGLAGLGDLVVTCTSELSRNRRLGRAIGAGRALEEFQAGTPQVAEGVNACRAAVSLSAEHGVSMPITQQVEAVLFGHRDPSRALADLLGREARSEDAEDGSGTL